MRRTCSSMKASKKREGIRWVKKLVCLNFNLTWFSLTFLSVDSTLPKFSSISLLKSVHSNTFESKVLIVDSRATLEALDVLLLKSLPGYEQIRSDKESRGTSWQTKVSYKYYPKLLFREYYSVNDKRVSNARYLTGSAKRLPSSQTPEANAPYSTESIDNQFDSAG